MTRLHLEAGLSALILASTACGAARMVTEVPLTLAATAERIEEVVPSVDKATVIVIYDGATEETPQAITIVSERGEFLGQVSRGSWFVAELQPGVTGIYAGRPELQYSEWCRGVRGAVEAGRVYVLVAASNFAIASLASVDADKVPMTSVGSDLGKFTRLAPDTRRGQSETARVRRSFWQPCFDAQPAHDKELAEWEFGMDVNVQKALRLSPANGYDRVTISPLP